MSNNYTQLLESKQLTDVKSEQDIVLEGQYKDAYDAMMDAYHANLYVGLIGPVGSGKTALCRRFAQDLNRPFDWVTFSDLVRPSNLIGSFDPTLVFKFGYSTQAFVPGPFTISALQGGVFLANEMNRGDEYVLNTLLDALEERKLYLPALRTWYQVDKNFYLIAAMNPSEQRGTRRLPGAVKDRIKVWVQLGYPKRAVEQKIVKSHCGEYDLTPARIESILELVHSTREEPAVEQPASIRSSIGIARLASERAKRMKTPVDNTIVAQAAQLVLTEAIKMKPGRSVQSYLDNLLTRVLGTTGA
ncbi:MAG TPA: MoxR family ATPase [Gemmataceae bacterium]|nr:MoxR family ATPase [Gemmataceae bacterium]